MVIAMNHSSLFGLAALQRTPDRTGGGGGGVCLKGRCSGGKLRAVTKRLVRTVKSVGGQSLAVGNAAGGGIGVADALSGRVEGGAWGGGGHTPLPSSKALGGGGLLHWVSVVATSLACVHFKAPRWSAAHQSHQCRLQCFPCYRR